MRFRKAMFFVVLGLPFALFSLSACSTYSRMSYQDYPSGEVVEVPLLPEDDGASVSAKPHEPDYTTRMPQSISPTGEKVVMVNPRVHAFGAYDANGNLVKAGQVTAGGNWCHDIKRPCRTKSGSFHVQSLGEFSCKSTRYPLPHGGAPMPYCMYFNGNQALHGSYEVVDGNASHGCVRLRVEDAKWLRFNFVSVGTKVVVEPY